MLQIEFPQSSFLGGWVIPEAVVDEMINVYYSHQDQALPGQIHGDKVDKTIKDSKDLSIYPDLFDFPFDQYRHHLQLCLESYLNLYTRANEVQPFNIYENYNIQHYPIGGGFKEYHFENDGLGYRTDRHLVFMTYLNDVPDGGTHFEYQDITVPAKKGLTILWPAHWTHTHKGITSSTREKIIITGWYSFNNKENL